MNNIVMKLWTKVGFFPVVSDLSFFTIYRLLLDIDFLLIQFLTCMCGFCMRDGVCFVLRCLHEPFLVYLCFHVEIVYICQWYHTCIFIFEHSVYTYPSIALTRYFQAKIFVDARHQYTWPRESVFLQSLVEICMATCSSRTLHCHFNGCLKLSVNCKLW